MPPGGTLGGSRESFCRSNPKSTECPTEFRRSDVRCGDLRGEISDGAMEIRNFHGKISEPRARIRRFMLGSADSNVGLLRSAPRTGRFWAISTRSTPESIERRANLCESRPEISRSSPAVESSPTEIRNLKAEIPNPRWRILRPSVETAGGRAAIAHPSLEFSPSSDGVRQASALRFRK